MSSGGSVTGLPVPDAGDTSPCRRCSLADTKKWRTGSARRQPDARGVSMKLLLGSAGQLCYKDLEIQ